MKNWSFRSTPLGRLSREGFSLVETVLAMAVMSLAVTVLLGLLPHGLEMARKAGTSSGESRVLTDVIAELSQVDWSEVQGYDGDEFLFDDQGVRLDTGNDGDISYVAQVEVPTGFKVPGATVNSDHVRRILVKIASTPRAKFEFKDDQEFATFTILIARRN